MENRIKNKWNELLQKNYFPTYVRHIKKIEFSKFSKIINEIGEDTDKLIEDVFFGDVLIVKNVFDRTKLMKLKEKIFEIEKKEKEKEFKMSYEIPNFHVSNNKNLYKIQTKNINYNETAHSHFFFRWNNDDLKIFDYFDKIWNLVKIFSGLNKDEFKKNKPKDKIIDRIQVLRYPLNRGKITTHCDVSAWQKLNIGICLYDFNKDFDEGGLYLIDKYEKKINVENHVNIGDCVCWIPTIFHGVDTPKLKNKSCFEWSSSKGRWQAVALAIQSNCVNERITSTGFENFKKNPEKYKKIYRDAFFKNF